MAILNWDAFKNLNGDPTANFENLCRGLVRIHFERFGIFRALSNQPGVEFHLNIEKECSLGGSERWYGWQCKYFERTKAGNLKTASKRDITDSMEKSTKHVPNLTDWVLWTPYTLSKKDQEWIDSLDIEFDIHLWAEEELNNYLAGEGVIFKSTYFGELVLSPERLKVLHSESIQPIKDRWLEPIHQVNNAERKVRRMLAEPEAFEDMIKKGINLKDVSAHNIPLDNFTGNKWITKEKLELILTPFIEVCESIADILMNFEDALKKGELEYLEQVLNEQEELISANIASVPRKLRSWNLPNSLDATNLLEDIKNAQNTLNEIRDFLGVGLVAIMADAGLGKTQMAAELTKEHANRPAGILLHGRKLKRGHSLNELVKDLNINGKPVGNFERLLASLDATAKRAKCRLPIVIDGLNEAENPKDWKSSLSILQEQVKKYPNVLVVCTLRTGEHARRQRYTRQIINSDNRESFAVMSLPDDLMKIESNGFDEGSMSPIRDYFRYYKIKSGSGTAPLKLLRHPLTLRIFCQMINPDRKETVVVDSFPGSEVPLFEQYISNICVRIAQQESLSYSYQAVEVEEVIYQLGEQLLESGMREIEERDLKQVLNPNITRDWNSSIINLLAQEGIIYRNPSSKPNNYSLIPAYDALGGYLIAKVLIAEHANDRRLTWLNSEETKDFFIGDNTHELSNDVFESLVSLIPRNFTGTQLWKVAPEELSQPALELLIENDPQFIDEETIKEIKRLFNEDKATRESIFFPLKRMMAFKGHPFSERFFDEAMSKLSIKERDLSWTEWVRRDRWDVIKEIKSFEKAWMDKPNRTSYDKSRMKWFMWILTTTDHELRDYCTRAIYWFGRGNPQHLFEETIKSLTINDVYIPERMLAASYGVCMALQNMNGNKDFRNEILPNFARQVYREILSAGAPNKTTHALIREYVYGIIELSLLYNKDLFTDDEIVHMNIIFNGRESLDWEESKNGKGEMLIQNSPFNMDFENYTIGRLVPERGNYDYKNKDYQSIRSKILWRVEQLGWSYEDFQEIDARMGSNRPHRNSKDGSRIDRYGKKYSWIAYYEMYGSLFGKDDMDEWEVRTSSVDVDPSFPDTPRKGKFTEIDMLGSSKLEMNEWIKNGEVPDLSKYYIIDSFQDLDGKWVMLDGYVTQQDEVRGRRLFTIIRSFMVFKGESESFFNYLSKQSLGGRWLPERPSLYYTFAGEIPWSKHCPDNTSHEFTFEVSSKTVTVTKKKKDIILDGKVIETIWEGEPRYNHPKLFSVMLGVDNKKDFERLEIVEGVGQKTELEVETVQYEALIPVCDFNWESYHSILNNAGGKFLSKKIAMSLNLYSKPQSFDLYSPDGSLAAFFIEDSSESYSNKQSAFYIREDVLKEFLDESNMDLVWANWGEREYSLNQGQKLFHGPDHPEQTYGQFQFIKKFK